MSQAGPWASRPWPQSPALPVFSLCPLSRDGPAFWGCSHGLRSPSLLPGCVSLSSVPRCPLDAASPGMFHGPLELITAHTALHTAAPAATCTKHPLQLPYPISANGATIPVPTPGTQESPPPSCPTCTASAQSPNQAVVSCPMSLMALLVFPASALIRTPTPPNGLLLWPPPSQPFSTVPPQLRPSTGFLQPQGSPHSARVPKEPSVSPGMTFSCPHAPAPRTGLLAPTGQFLSSLPLLPFSLACQPPARLVEPLLVV